MNVLIVYAHPEPKSLNGSLKDHAVEQLTRAGHTIKVSDLYGDGWKSALDRADFPAWDPNSPLNLIAASEAAFKGGSQTLDVSEEQAKLLWADAVLFHFPIWWFSMPAILKGWVERVYAYGFAYGVGEVSDTRYGDRFGEGPFKGKRAMLVVTAGGQDVHYGERGINGPMEDVLFPINHGILYYPGFDVLQPLVVYGSGRIDDDRFAQVSAELDERLADLFTAPPIAYRPQNGGDYAMPSLQLKPGLESDNQHGIRLHVTSA